MSKVNLNQLKKSVFNMKNYVDYNSKNAYNKKAMGIFDITLDENGVITNTANATSYYVKTTNNQHYLTWSKDDFPIKSDGYVLMKIDIDGEYNFNTYLMKIDTYTSRSFVGNIKLDNNTFVFQIATRFNQKYTYNDGKAVSESKENTQSMFFMFYGKDGKIINRTIHLEYYYYEDNNDTFVQFPGLKGVNHSITYMENNNIIGDNSINLSNDSNPDYTFIIGGNSRNIFNNECSYGSIIGYGNNLNKINYYNIIGMYNTVEGKLDASYNEYFINIMGQHNTYKADASTINYKPVSILGNHINACNSGLYIGMGGTFEKDDIMGIANGTGTKENIIFKVKRDGRVKASIPTENDDLTTKKYVDDKIAGLVNSAPETLDTLNELATALGDDPNFATTMTTTLGNKVDKVDGKTLSTNDLTNELKANYDAAYTHSQSVHFDGDYNSLSNIPTDLVKTTDADSKYAPIDSPNFTNAISMGRLSSSTIGKKSTALGNYVQATADCSHAEGQGSIARGNYSHAEGSGALSEGIGSHAENTATARGDYSHAEGSGEAIGVKSHAEGNQSKANAEGSHAEGYNTLASGQYQHVQGKYNVEDTTGTYAHIIGNGTGSGARSNAHTVDWNGNAWYKGDVYIGGTNQETNAKKLATEDYVNNKVSGLVDSAPETLDTLKELATALGNDPNFATTISNQIGNKVDKVNGKGLSTNDLTDALKSNYDTAYTHSQSAHAPSNAQKNSDITKAEIEAKLTGDITTHTHSQYLTSIPSEYITEQELTSKGYITEAVLTSKGYATESQINSAVEAAATTDEEVKTTVNQILGGDYIE